jgi:hypothetical protein
VAEIGVDSYVFDSLMRDLVGHDRSAAAFLVYLCLWRQTNGSARASAGLSYSALAEATGLSKRTVQAAVGRLLRRRLIRVRRARITSVPQYSVLRPWSDRTVAQA